MAHRAARTSPVDLTRKADAVAADEPFIPIVKVGDASFVTMVGRDATTATKCLICGASVIDRDRHWDWHAETANALTATERAFQELLDLIKSL
jgi:hypothetical protein